MTALLLTKEERQSALWRKLQAHWDERLASLRSQNDGQFDAVVTAKIRGQIAEIKACLALDKDLPQAPPQ
jgi:hypothetical protein